MSKTVKSSHFFGLVEKFVITDIAETEPYLIRWQVRAPFNLFTVKLHKICRPDADRCPHDHPWGFLRVILSGGYVETYGPDGHTQVLEPGSVTYCPPSFRHRIVALTDGGPSWSLVITGPRVQDWGFYTRQGWVQWEKFVNALRSEAILWCDDGTAAVLGVKGETAEEFHTGGPAWKPVGRVKGHQVIDEARRMEEAYIAATSADRVALPLSSCPGWPDACYCPRFCSDRHEARRKLMEHPGHGIPGVDEAFQVPLEVFVPKEFDCACPFPMNPAEVEEGRQPTVREMLSQLPSNLPPDPDWRGERYSPRFDCPECGVRVRGVRWTMGCNCTCGALIAPWTIKGPWPIPRDDKDPAP